MDQFQTLIKYCQNGDLDKVKKMDVNLLQGADDLGNRPIHYAVLSGNIDLVKYLLNFIHIGCYNNDYLTPFFTICMDNKLNTEARDNMICFLITQGADVMEQNGDSRKYVRGKTLSVIQHMLKKHLILYDVDPFFTLQYKRLQLFIGSLAYKRLKLNGTEMPPFQPHPLTINMSISELSKLCNQMSANYNKLISEYNETSEIIELCGGCLSKENLKCCGGCKKIKFCSIECQKEIWFIHKKECQYIQTLNV